MMQLILLLISAVFTLLSIKTRIETAIARGDCEGGWRFYSTIH